MTFPEQICTEEALRQYREGSEFREYFADVPGRLFDRVLRYGSPVGCLIENHDRLPRCMGRLRELIDATEPGSLPVASGTVVIARELDGSCGRFDREWFAPRGGLWLAMAWADTLLPDYARLLPLAAGSASCQTLQSFGVDAAVKWVNDIHVAGSKIGGILCETYFGKAAGDCYQLIGIGINCNNVHFPESLLANATSLKLQSGTTVDLGEFTARLLGFLTWHIGLVHLFEEEELRRKGSENQAESANPVIDTWLGFSDTVGRKVLYGYDVVRHPQYRATAVDVDRAGGLVLRLPDGGTVTEYSGEILYLPDEEDI